MIYLLIILIIFLITPIRVVVSKDENRSDIDFYFTRIFNLHIDFDEFIKALFTEKDDPDKISAPKILRTYNTYKKIKPFVATTTKMVPLNKITFIIKTKGESLQAQTWNYVISWTLISFLQNFVHGNFKRVKDEYYNQSLGDKTNIYFELQFNIRLIYLLFSFIRNIKKFIRLRKKKKGRNKYGTASNS